MRAFAVALLLGALSVGGFAPFHLFPLPVLTLAGLFLLWRHAADARRAALLGFAYGLGMFGLGVSWVYVSLHRFGGMPALLAAVATVLFCAMLALFPALTGYLQARLPARAGLRAALLAPALWTGAEWLRGWLFTGFPWIAVGYSQVPSSPLAGWAPLAGIYGVSLATALSAGMLAAVASAVLRERPRAMPGRLRAALAQPAWLVIAMLWIGGLALARVEWTRPAGEPVMVSLLQGNVPQSLKWREDQARKTLSDYLALTESAAGRLVVLPETALPLFRHQVPDEYWEHLTAGVRARGGDLVAGLVESEPGGRYYNAMVSAGASPAQSYRKHHLVPFGEFIPPGFGWIINILHIPLSDFARGPALQRPLAVAGQRLAVNICYEDAFGEEIIRQLPEATLLANVSNDAWFGDSFALWQHLQMSQARALETGRVMLRATNTGVTAAIGHTGRVEAHAPPHRVAVLEHRVQGRAGATPYVRWGNGPALALALVTGALAFPFGRPRGLGRGRPIA